MKTYVWPLSLCFQLTFGFSTDETKRQRKVDASTHIGTFVTVFCATAVILKNSYAANNVTLFDSLFGREQTWSDVTFYWLKRVFYIGSLNDFGKMLVRAIFSSFAKDGIISIWSPKTYTNKAHGATDHYL